MAFLGQEPEIDEHEKAQQKATIVASAAAYRDQLFDENQWAAVKVIGGTLLGLYFVYRYLFKQV